MNTTVAPLVPSKIERTGPSVCPCCGRPVPVEPTDHRPGSDEKIDVMALRASLGLCLYHPLDAQGAVGLSRATPVANIQAVISCMIVSARGDRRRKR